MRIKTIDDLVALTGRPIWFVRHVCGYGSNGTTLGADIVQTNRAVIVDWQVGPILRVRERGGIDANESIFEVMLRADLALWPVEVDGSSRQRLYNVDGRDSRLQRRSARTILLSGYLGSLTRRVDKAWYGLSAAFSTEQEAETHAVLIALSCEYRPDFKSTLGGYLVQTQTSPMPDDLYRKTGFWARAAT